MKLSKIISGGQTGADQGAIYGAHAAGFPTGGTAPGGFRTEVGPNPGLARYGLVESNWRAYSVRTFKNVADADATVIFSEYESPGTRCTRNAAIRCEKPYIIVDPLRQAPAHAAARIARFCREENVHTLNVAGHRESKAKGIQHYVARTIAELCRIAANHEHALEPGI